MRATFVPSTISTWFLLRKPSSTIEARQPQEEAWTPPYYGVSGSSYEFGLVWQ